MLRKRGCVLLIKKRILRTLAKDSGSGEELRSRLRFFMTFLVASE
jgi:hypothetical protein